MRRCNGDRPCEARAWGLCAVCCVLCAVRCRRARSGMLRQVRLGVALRGRQQCCRQRRTRGGRGKAHSSQHTAHSRKLRSHRPRKAPGGPLGRLHCRRGRRALPCRGLPRLSLRPLLGRHRARRRVRSLQRAHRRAQGRLLRRRRVRVRLPPCPLRHRALPGHPRIHHRRALRGTDGPPSHHPLRGQWSWRSESRIPAGCRRTSG